MLDDPDDALPEVPEPPEPPEGSDGTTTGNDAGVVSGGDVTGVVSGGDVTGVVSGGDVAGSVAGVVPTVVGGSVAGVVSTVVGGSVAGVVSTVVGSVADGSLDGGVVACATYVTESAELTVVDVAVPLPLGVPASSAAAGIASVSNGASAKEHTAARRRTRRLPHLVRAMLTGFRAIRSG